MIFKLFEPTLFAELYDIVQSLDVDADSKRHILFTHRRQEGAGSFKSDRFHVSMFKWIVKESLVNNNFTWSWSYLIMRVPKVDQPVNPMVDNNFLKAFEVEDVRKQERTFHS